MMKWTMDCLNKQRTADNELVRDCMYGIDFSDIPSRVAEAWESGKYYHVSAEGPSGAFCISNSKDLCSDGDLCYFLSTSFPEGHIKKVGDKFTVRRRGHDEIDGEFNTLEEAIRSFNSWWMA